MVDIGQDARLALSVVTAQQKQSSNTLFHNLSTSALPLDANILQSSHELGQSQSQEHLRENSISTNLIGKSTSPVLDFAPPKAAPGKAASSNAFAPNKIQTF